MAKKTNVVDESLQDAIAKLQAQLSQAQQERDIRLGNAQKIEDRRRRHVVAARVKKDAQAQAELKCCDDDLVALNRDIKDDDSAIGELTAQIEALQVELAQSEWSLQCDRVKALISARANGEHEKRLLVVLLQATDIAEQMRRADEEIALSLCGLHPSLYSASVEIRSAEKRRRDLVSILMDRAGLVESVVNFAWASIMEKQGFVALATWAFPASIRAVEEIEQQMMPHID